MLGPDRPDREDRAPRIAHQRLPPARRFLRPVQDVAAQLREGLNQKGVGRWRAYEDQLTPVLPVLAPWVRRFGYDEE